MHKDLRNKRKLNLHTRKGRRHRRSHSLLLTIHLLLKLFDTRLIKVTLFEGWEHVHGKLLGKLLMYCRY
jgi:hypothetical protein